MDTRTDSGQFYPGGKVLPRQPGGGGGTVVLDDTVTEGSVNGVKSSGIWTWVKSLLPSWLTASCEKPPTVASVNGKYTKPAGGIPKTDLASDVQTSLGKADTALQSHQDVSGKRDLGDRHFGDWVKVSGGPSITGLVWYEDEWWLAYSDEPAGGGGTGNHDPYATYAGKTVSGEAYYFTRDALAIESEVAANYVAKEQGKGLSTNDYTTEEKAEVAKVKGKADEFTQWNGVPVGGRLRYYGDNLWGFEAPYGTITWYTYGTARGEEDATTLNFESMSMTYDPFVATRKRVLRTGDVTSLPYLRVWDEQSQCWWRGVMQGGVLNWEVEEES